MFIWDDEFEIRLVSLLYYFTERERETGEQKMQVIIKLIIEIIRDETKQKN